jgi:hypothetical protein
MLTKSEPPVAEAFDGGINQAVSRPAGAAAVITDQVAAATPDAQLELDRARPSAAMNVLRGSVGCADGRFVSQSACRERRTHSIANGYLPRLMSDRLKREEAMC